MPPLSKKPKLQVPESNELLMLRNEIRKIKGLPGLPVVEREVIAEEHDYNAPEVDQKCEKSQTDSEDIKKFIREKIRLSERRIEIRLESIDRKLDRLLELQTQPPTVPDDEAVDEEFLENVATEDIAPDSIDMDNRIFPICDEITFDWFFEKLMEEEYRNSLIERRWQLTRNVSTKSFNISVKDFLRMHFELAVCVNYSVSGYGAHGIRKKKFDSNSLTIFVFECFNRTRPDVHSFRDINKAIVQFWGRAPDSLNKANCRVIKQEELFE